MTRREQKAARRRRRLETGRRSPNKRSPRGYTGVGTGRPVR